MEQFFDQISDGLLRCKIVYSERTGKVDLLILYANEKIKNITGKTSEEITDKTFRDTFPSIRESIFDWPKIIADAAMTNEKKVIEGYFVEFGKYLKLNIFGYRDSCFDIIITDLTEKKEIKRRLIEKNREIKHLEEELKSRANLDMLTKLYNFQYVVECIDESIECYKEDGTNFCVLIVDIDEYYDINRKYGFKAGDAVLQDIAALLSTTARKIDIVGRYENDKFIFVFNNMNMEIAQVMVERLKQQMKKDAIKLRGIQISFSGALSEYDGERLEDFIYSIEDKMEKAKKLGKGTIIS
jgi:diguanylate cyclase (GGDEF)-like protein